MLLSVLFEEMSKSADTVKVVADFVFLVGGMQAVVGETEAHQDGGDTDVLCKIPNNRDRAAGAGVDGGLTEDVAEGFGGDADSRVIRVDHQAGAGAEHPHFERYAAR